MLYCGKRVLRIRPGVDGGRSGTWFQVQLQKDSWYQDCRLAELTIEESADQRAIVACTQKAMPAFVELA